MSHFDDLIGRLHETGADRLMLASGKHPVLDVAGEAVPIDEDDPLTRDALDAMIAHLGGSEELGRQEFTYQAPGGGVLVTARRTERLVQLIVIPAAVGRPEPVAVGGEQDVEEEAAADAYEPHVYDEPSAPDPQEDGAAGPGWTGGSGTFDEIPAGFGEVDHAVEPPAVGPGLYVVEEDDVDVAPAAGLMAEIESDLFEPPGPDPSTNGGGIDADDRGIEARDLGVDEEDALDAARLAPLPEIDDPEPDTAGPATDETTEASGPEPAAPADERVFEVRADAPAMERLFLKMVQHGCSDLHVSAGSAPLFRKDGRITDIGGEPALSAGQTEALLMGITPDRYRKEFEQTNDADFAYQIPGVARFRCNLFRDRKGMGGVFRQIPAEILGADTLGLPKPLLDMCQLKKGLVLVTGPTGSGKSTTLAALIDYINKTRHDHIITIEDPIEFVHDNGTCLVNQREVGEHTKSFKVALRAALREDPDIVLVGELRDLETVEIALETAETGHLVFGTLHTNTAPGTVSRLIDQFPAGQQAQIRTMLADTLKAVVAQTLCRKREGGRIAALEILVVSNAVANLIREDKTHQIPSSMQTGRSQGMRTLNDSLLDLVVRRVVDVHEAYWNAVDKPEFIGVLKRNGIEVEGLGQE